MKHNDNTTEISVMATGVCNTEGCNRGNMSNPEISGAWGVIRDEILPRRRARVIYRVVAMATVFIVIMLLNKTEGFRVQKHCKLDIEDIYEL